MNDLQIKAIMAGIFFGLWPLFMNKSGLNGNVSSVAFGLAIVVGVLPFALYSNGLSIPTANWKMVFIAGALAAAGLLFFNGMLSEATSQNVATLIVLMTVFQVIVAALYQNYLAGWNIPIDKMVGYVLATVTTWLLLR